MYACTSVVHRKCIEPFAGSILCYSQFSVSHCTQKKGSTYIIYSIQTNTVQSAGLYTWTKEHLFECWLSNNFCLGLYVIWPFCCDCCWFQFLLKYFLLSRCHIKYWFYFFPCCCISLSSLSALFKYTFSFHFSTKKKHKSTCSI